MDTTVSINPNSKSNRAYFWVGLVILAVLILLAILSYYSGLPKVSTPKVNPLPAGYVFKDTGAGQYPTGFPKAVVVAAGAPVWQRGEDDKDAAGHQIKIVELLYQTTSPTVVLAEYQSSFKAAGWTAATVINSSGSIIQNFSKQFNIITLLIVPQGGGSFVNLTQNTN